MKTMNRRQMLKWLAAASAFSAGAAQGQSPQRPTAKRLGVSAASYGFHRRAHSGDAADDLNDPLRFLERCRSLNAGGMQIHIGHPDRSLIARFREQREKHGLFFEAQIGLPKQKEDLDRFEAEIRAAKEAGAAIIRTVMLSGRRYETFETLESFRHFKRASWEALLRAEPVVRKHRVQLAVENHKDWRVEEMLDILQRISSEHVGVCVDTGNSISLLEPPMTFIEAYAPYALTSHFKDMAVQPYEDGFLLSEVPLGDGFLNLQKVVAVLLKGNPRIQFNLEMITRDPLKIPCLTEKYWATFPRLPGKHLARAWAMVREHTSQKPLPRVEGLTAQQRLELEEHHVRRSFAWAEQHLDFQG